MSDNPAKERSLNFLKEIIAPELRRGKSATILTPFQPEHNGYTNISHA